MPQLETDRLSIYFEERGSGQPLLVFNGTGGDLRQRPGVLDGPVAEAFHVIAHDQRGLGQTEKPAGPYTMADYADDGAALLDALGLEQASVVGISFGGMVAQHFAIRHPQKVNKLVLCCTSPGGDLPSYPFNELPEGLSPVERMLKLMHVSDTRRDAAWQQANPEMVQKMAAFTEENIIADHATAEFQRGAKLQLEARAGHDTNDELSGLHMPVMICAGRYDGIAPEDNQHRLHQLIDGSSLHWYDGGHLFLIQDKKAWQDIISFLKEG